jgi:hypothetical protein
MDCTRATDWRNHQRILRKATGREVDRPNSECCGWGIGGSFAFAAFFTKLLPLPAAQRVVTEHLFAWIKVGSFQADFAYLLDPLSGSTFFSSPVSAC